MVSCCGIWQSPLRQRGVHLIVSGITPTSAPVESGGELGGAPPHLRQVCMACSLHASRALPRRRRRRPTGDPPASTPGP